ncbi:MAG TPA: cytochrome c biogenesis protein CcdA, partial [Bryobacteraceae bacterium]
MVRLFSLPGLLLLLSALAFGQRPEEVVKWSGHVAKSAGHTEAVLTGKISPGWHVYSITQPPGGPNAASVSVPAGQAFHIQGPITGTQPRSAFDPNFQMKTEFYESSVTLKVPLATESAANAQNIRINVRFQTCNDRLCLPPKTVRLDLPVTGGEVNATVPTSRISAPLKDTKATPAASTRQSLGAFIWLALGMGALSLLTPCVFPMIPITVSYFTSHSANDRGAALRRAVVYSLGIILSFTALGMVLALVFGAGGVNQLAANPWVNLLITAIFLGFALSLFGAYFIQVPTGLIGKLDSLAHRPGTSDFIGTLLMGLTFTLTSFTCTSPFVGTLLVTAAGGSWQWPLLGMLAFSTVFALPFFVLALAPQLMAQLPRSGGWLNSVKVVMGFLEIAAAMKFLSNADLIWHWGIFSREVVLAVWVAIGILSVLYLLGKFQMPHDSPVASITALRVLAAIFFLSISIWLGTGLFGRPLGEIESFLPPPSDIETNGATATGSSKEPAEMSWILNDYPAALAQAKLQNKPIFIDFTGYTCTNCRWMEANMVSRPEVRKELNNFVRVRLYTDGSGAIYEQQQEMERQRFDTVALPFYTVLSSSGAVVSTFPGLTRNPDEFLKFLRSRATVSASLG